MIRLSRLTDYAVVLLSSMAQEEGRVIPASALSERTGVPEPTVAKILKILARGGIISSVRGIAGGYRLEKRPTELTISAIINAMEGPVSLTACVEGSDECCAIQDKCALKGRWNPVNEAIRGALDRITLADMGKGG